MLILLNYMKLLSNKNLYLIQFGPYIAVSASFIKINLLGIVF